MNPWDATAMLTFNPADTAQGFYGFATNDGSANIKALVVRPLNFGQLEACVIESVKFTVGPFDPACCA